MILNWIFWPVPREYIRRYFITLWLVLFFLPALLLGVRLTMLGLLVNFLWYDIVFYGWVKFKERFDQPDITENPADAGRGKSSFHEAATGMTKSLDKTAEALELLNKTLGGEGKDKDKDMMTSAVEQGAGKYLHGSPPYLKTVAENTRG